MSIAGPVVAFDTVSSAKPVAAFLSQARSILARISDAISVANENRAKREIERFVMRHGGCFNDEIERRIGEVLRRS
jgi:hypothetical protein